MLQCSGPAGNSVGADGAACTSQGVTKTQRVSYLFNVNYNVQNLQRQYIGEALHYLHKRIYQRDTMLRSKVTITILLKITLNKQVIVLMCPQNINIVAYDMKPLFLFKNGNFFINTATNNLNVHLD